MSSKLPESINFCKEEQWRTRDVISGSVNRGREAIFKLRRLGLRLKTCPKPSPDSLYSNVYFI